MPFMDTTRWPWQRFSVQLPDDVAADLRQRAERDHRSYSYVICQAVVAYLAERAAAEVCPECKRPASA